jgi:TetR/AcrR family transcriptional regulator, regulator of biofilm formation and stress response
MPARHRNPDRTRAAILAATLRIIGERGLEAVRHRAVAEAAGVSLGSVPNHFATREELLSETLRYAATSERQRLHIWALELQDSVFELESWTSSIVSKLSDDVEHARWRWLAAIELQLACARDPDLRPIMEEVLDAYRRLFVLAFRAAASDDPTGDADLMVAALTGAVIKQLAFPADDFATRLERLSHGLIEGLGVRPSTRVP